MKGQVALSRPVTVALVLLISACTARRFDITAIRSGMVSAEGVTNIRIATGAGWLRIEGRPGSTQIRATGTAHASSEELLNRIRLSITRSGNDVVITTDVPEYAQPIGQAAALDLTLEVPMGVPLHVTDASGETIIRNVGPLTIADNTGGLDIEGVMGDLNVRDGSGELQVSAVHGDVHIADGSGSIFISHITGSVTIPTDGSGEIQVADVSGDLTIDSKASGEVAARDVGGNFVVDAKGNGSIEYHGIRGRVSLPSRGK